MFTLYDKSGISSMFFLISQSDSDSVNIQVKFPFPHSTPADGVKTDEPWTEPKECDSQLEQLDFILTLPAPCWALS